MKLDDKIKVLRIAYLFKGDQPAAFHLSVLYFVMARRRAAENKISDALKKSIQWLDRANVKVADDIFNLEVREQIVTLQKILVANKALVCGKKSLSAEGRELVRATPMEHRGIGLVPQVI